MARKPQGPQALTGAERQAALSCTARGTGGGTDAGVTALTTAHQLQHALPHGCGAGRPRLASLSPCRPSMPAWLAAMPEATRDGATGEALQAINIDLDLDEIMTIQPPRGFGRDWTARGQHTPCNGGGEATVGESLQIA